MECIAFERDGAIATLTVRRPQVLNALNRVALEEIDQVIRQVESDRSVRVVIITGAGDRSFIAGADIGELTDLTPMEARRSIQFGQAVFRRIERLEAVTIAAINGFALGGGCELALSCTLRIASESAQIGLPEVGLGMIPGYGGTQRLPRLIGKANALELILTGKRIPAAQAKVLGLVNAVVPPDELLQKAREWAQIILQKSPEAVRLALRAVNDGTEMPLDEGLAYELFLDTYLFSTVDRAEGIRAFLEKRTPRFEDR